MIRQSYTAVVERNVLWEGDFVTEPYECGWATEAILFVRQLESQGTLMGTHLHVQISPDGMHWCDEGTVMRLTGAEVDFCKVVHFGNWLRLQGELPEGATMRVIVTLVLKE
ncbi:MAG: hypothetical protein ACLFV5_03380 [Anaerolineales bacterium]